MKTGLILLGLAIGFALAGCGQGTPTQTTPVENPLPNPATDTVPALETSTVNAEPSATLASTLPQVASSSPTEAVVAALALTDTPTSVALASTSTPVIVAPTSPKPAATAAQPTATATATSPSLVAALQDQLFLAGIPSDNTIQLGIVRGCPALDELAKLTGQATDLPYLYNVGRLNKDGRSTDMGQLCLYGLPAGAALQIELHRPDGSLAETAQLQVDALSPKISRLLQVQPPLSEEVGYAGLSGEEPLFSLMLWQPAGLPTGEWTLVAHNDQGQGAKGVFKVDSYAPQPAIGLTKPHVGPYAAKANPFNRPAVESGCHEVKPGQTVPIYVVNLSPGSIGSLGIYQLVQVSANLIAKLPFQVNKKGNQQVDLAIPADWPAGRYYAVLPLNAGATQLDKAGPLTCFQITEAN